MIRKSKKMAVVRQRRITSFYQMQAKGFADLSKNERLKNGGYRCPGSNKAT